MKFTMHIFRLPHFTFFTYFIVNICENYYEYLYEQWTTVTLGKGFITWDVNKVWRKHFHTCPCHAVPEDQTPATTAIPPSKMPMAPPPAHTFGNQTTLLCSFMHRGSNWTVQLQGWGLIRGLVHDLCSVLQQSSGIQSQIIARVNLEDNVHTYLFVLYHHPREYIFF